MEWLLAYIKRARKLSFITFSKQFCLSRFLTEMLQLRSIMGSQVVVQAFRPFWVQRNVMPKFTVFN